MRQIKAKIIENKRISNTFYRMRVESPYLAKNSRPGQFLEVRCSDSALPLLRRPLGTHKILKDGIEMLYEVVGRATDILSRRKTGEVLDIIGPLGNGFDLRGMKDEGRGTIVLIAGGIGVAPLVALAEKLKKRNIYALIGVKTKNQILCEKDFKKIGAKVIISTEDGSRGRCGFITDCLASLLSTIDYRLSTIYACGPNVMMREVAKIAKAHRIPCQVLLEEYMACGVGVCLGCPVKVRPKITSYELPVTSYEYKMVCKDGPVFDAEEIVW